MNNNVAALSLVITSGFIHMVWNSRYKISKNPNQLFAGTRVLNLLYLLPFCIYMYEPISIKGLIYISASGLIHYFYFYFLILMYNNEDFSKVYPLSRGLGNLLTPILGVTLIKETISKISMGGILINLAGLLLLNTRKPGNPKKLNKGTIFSIITGITITAYSYIDKLGVEELNPVQYFYSYMLITFVIYNFVAVLNKEILYTNFLSKKNLLEYSFVGLSDTFSYLLILYSLTFTEVSYIAPMRNSGIVISSFMGFVYLNEKFNKIRAIGSIVIFIGIIIITIGIE
jgi:drug/metabolite transporter (DMT)-like permease